MTTSTLHTVTASLVGEISDDELLARTTLERLLARVSELRTVDGTGQEGYGMGDPRIPERREAVGTLLAAVELGFLSRAQLESYGPRVQNDIRWLEAADGTDIAPSSDSATFWWAANHFTTAETIAKEYTKQAAEGRRRAQDFASGRLCYFEALDHNVIGVTFLTEPGRREAALADVLLQFRGLAERVPTRAKRNNEVGPPLLAGLRLLLASARVDSSPGAHGKEYALLRAVVGAHIMNSSNTLFEARNAIGSFFLDGDPLHKTGRRGNATHETSWLRTDIPPGATYSPYSAIHWNFGSDTRQNITLFIRHWMFARGPMDERTTLFLRLTDALTMARAGEAERARQRLFQEIHGTQKETLAPLLDRLDGLPKTDVAEAILDFLSRRDVCTKDLGSRPEANLQLAARVYRCVCEADVGPNALLEHLFRAGRAWPYVAQLVRCMDHGDAAGTLRAIGRARLALRDAVRASTTGVARHQHLSFDHRLERLSLESLGHAVDQTGDFAGEAQRHLGLVALQCALRCVLASGLEAFLPGRAGSASATFEALIAEISEATQAQELAPDEFRRVMSRAHRMVRETVQGLQNFVDERAATMAGDGGRPSRVKWRKLRRRITTAADAFSRWAHASKKDPPVAARIRRTIRMVFYQKVVLERYVERSSFWSTASRHVAPFLARQRWTTRQPMLDLDPMFVDQFLKETPLHYATALAEKGRRACLVERISEHALENVAGMRILNSIGPAVFSRVVVVESDDELCSRTLGRADLVVCLRMDEKKRMPMGGGLVVDTGDAPGGNSHLSLYAMNSGLMVLALPDLASKFRKFFERAARPDQGGVFFDEKNGHARMLTVAHARELGLLGKGDERRLAPRMNLSIDYIAPGEGSERGVVQSRHEVFISTQRPSRRVEIYVPCEELDGRGRECMSFSQLALAGSRGRHLAGEKGFVLAHLRSDATLGRLVPDGAVIPFGRVQNLLTKAGLTELARQVWEQDPLVSVVDSMNFVRSAFHSNAAYRAETSARLRRATQALLRSLLLDDARANGLSPEGERLHEELLRAGMRGSKNWIVRSSFAGEDRPGKSAAGQYESVPHLQTARERIAGIIHVLRSAWDVAPIENNVAEEVDLRQLGASIVVQNCLQPQVSGVAISRDIELGTRGAVSYQLTTGFGGGVDGGHTEEGTISPFRASLQKSLSQDGSTLVDAHALAQLRNIVLEVERFYDRKIEPGMGHAVDVETARQGRRWYVVQARAVLLSNR